METRICRCLAIFTFLILRTYISQGQGNHSILANARVFSHSNKLNKRDVLNNRLEHSNNTELNLDLVFGVDRRIFEEYLKDEDLSIIPGMREDDDFENWTPPLEVQRDITVYIAGFDLQDRPIWISEWGKWKLDKYANGSPKKVALFEKYVRYIAYTIIKSLALRSTKERRVTHFVVLRDSEGLSPRYLLDRTILQFLLKKVSSNYRRFADKYAGKTIIINVNPIAEVLLNLALPFFKHQLGTFEIHGTNKYIWAPQLLKSIPKDQLPEWYGGNKGYVPFRRFPNTDSLRS